MARRYVADARFVALILEKILESVLRTLCVDPPARRRGDRAARHRRETGRKRSA